MVSDPGYRLAREAIAAGHNVIPIPGASAALAALTLAGLPTERFLFAGFPPPRDVFQHNDGVVDQQPDRERHAAQRHDVQR